MPQRRLANWLEAHADYVAEEEAAKQYHQWAAISCIAATLQRKVRCAWTAARDLKPNLYVFLVGHSGARKGEAIGVVKGIMEDAGLRLFPDSITWQALSAKLETYDDYWWEGDRLLWQHGGFVIAEEVINLVGLDDPEALGRFIELHNAERKYTRSTKTAGEDEVDFPYLNILGGATPQGMRMMFPSLARGGGFASRIIFIYSATTDRIVRDPSLIKRDTALRTSLVEDLRSIHTLQGRMTLHPEAHEIYGDWYVEGREAVESGEHKLLKEATDMEGWLARKGETARKIAMVLSAAKGDTMIVSPADMMEAMALVDEVDDYLPKVFPQSGFKGRPALVAAVSKMIKANGVPVNERRLLYDFHEECSWEALQEVLITLSKAGLIRGTVKGKEGKVYEWSGGEGS